MATTTYDLDRDVRTVEVMASRLTPYIYENELYGLMPNNLAKLTVGGLLMRLHRLRAIYNILSSKQQQEVSGAEEKFKQVEKDWRVALEKKIQQEFQARLTALHQYANEYVENPKLFMENYPSTAEKRTILEALADEARSLNFMEDDVKGDFIWDHRLEPAYPKEKYWFLYVK